MKNPIYQRTDTSPESQPLSTTSVLPLIPMTPIASLPIRVSLIQHPMPQTTFTLLLCP